MIEKRRSKRLNVNLELNISDLFKQDNVIIKHFDSPIHVIDISKHGLGFISSAVIPMGYYFNAKIELGSSKLALYTVVKIIRNVDHEDGTFTYGCEFVGLAPIFDYVFDDYEKSLENN